ncbi:MAG: cation-transporting P-type ATPase [Piscirickettsiaceae bacterium]|nr:cation-transporting P-type ATPase [Piscirickettsiaceae bacterium]
MSILHANAKRIVGKQTSPAWHAVEQTQVLNQLTSTLEGLTASDAAERLSRYGPNSLPEAESRSALKRFFAQCQNVLIYVLLAAAGITALLTHWIDTGVILAVVVINAVIGFIQEGKAEDALRAIKKMLSSQAMVIRDGKRIVIPSEELVIGDIILLQSGDKVPADCRLLKVKNLQVQESVLTGESLAVEKAIPPVSEDAVLGDRYSMVFSSTLVTYGQATAIVVATAADTEIGRISTLLSQVETLTTPLLRQMDDFGRLLTGIIVVIATLTLTFGVLVHDNSISDMFMAAVGLAVAAIPEGLPAIMTITLAIGVQKMAKRQAIIRLLPAVETLGAVTVICTDKTGTLTRNEMTVTNIATAGGGLFDVTGVGYDPHGAFLDHDKAIDFTNHPVLTELMRSALLCNDAVLKNNNGEWILQGDPTEAALLTLGMKAGLTPDFEHEAWPRTDSIPFESQHQFMATLHHDHLGHGVSYIKGAPERIFAMCRYQRHGLNDEPLDLKYWYQQMNIMAKQGQRVLAIACKNSSTAHRELTFSDIEQGLTLLGIVGMIDPPRSEAITAIKQCQLAGIKVKMITGDHAVTAVAIGSKMQIGDDHSVLTGHEIQLMTNEELRDVVDSIDIFARSSPEHKLRLVQALQTNGHVVAMTGDGVNDAPALKRADVGIAMGLNGTEVAKDAAEMVLADDHFSSIVDAIEEGRTVYDNLKKAILFILPTNGGEALIIIAAIILGTALPITPVQILWVNMITAVTLALAIAFEPPESNVMLRPPRNPKQPLLTPLFLWRIAFVSLILMVGTFSLFSWQQAQGATIEYARTVAVNTLVMFEIFYLFNSRYINDSVLSIQGLLGNRYALLATACLLLFQMAFTYFSPMQILFGTTGLEWTTWLVIILVSSSVLFLVELEKSIVRRFQPVVKLRKG